jgi:hypothetical protein
MVAEKAEEWGEEVWIASLDLEKAFDKVLHGSVFACLMEAHVQRDIIHVLWALYGKQTAYVQLNGKLRSRVFLLLRGVRQGDPLSPLLFNNVTRHIYADLRASWAQRGLGTSVCSNQLLKTTHAMFADDTVLLASNKRALAAMIKDVRAALSKHGLNLNTDKCLVQTNSSTASVSDVVVGDERIPMVSAYIGFKVLGTMFTLMNRTSAEIRARINAAWGKFHQLWPLLGKRDGNLEKRLRLFDTTVSQSLLWCCESWCITQKEKNLLSTTQNRMLRRIAGPNRRPHEMWVDWIKRSTRVAKALAKDAKVRFWVDAHLRAKYNWAGHVARMEEGRLAKRGSEWRDSVWWLAEQALPASLRYHRHGRTRWFRWEDEFKRFASHCGWTAWQDVARRRDNAGKPLEWSFKCVEFIKFALK